MAVRLGSPKAFPNRSLRTELGLAAVLATILFEIPAFAHEASLHDASNLWHAWHADPLISIPLLASCLLFIRGVWHLRRGVGRFPPGFGLRQIACFALGAVLLIIALLSPLEALSSCPPLRSHGAAHPADRNRAAASRSRQAWICVALGAAAALAAGLARHGSLRSLLAILSPCARPIPAALIHMATLWIWHSPMLFDAAVASDGLHWLEHVLFFGTALLFWRAVIKAHSGREAAAAALIASSITLLQSGLLSALLASPVRHCIMRPIRWTGV